MATTQKQNSVSPSFIKGSEVEALINDIENELEGTDFSLSRWQYNKNKHTVSIHYGIHSGDRPDQFRYRNDDLFNDWVELTQREGKTRRCEAFRELSSLLESAKLINQIQNMGA